MIRLSHSWAKCAIVAWYLLSQGCTAIERSREDEVVYESAIVIRVLDAGGAPIAMAEIHASCFLGKPPTGPRFLSGGVRDPRLPTPPLELREKIKDRGILAWKPLTAHDGTSTLCIALKRKRHHLLSESYLSILVISERHLEWGTLADLPFPPSRSEVIEFRLIPKIPIRGKLLNVKRMTEVPCSVVARLKVDDPKCGYWECDAKLSEDGYYELPGAPLAPLQLRVRVEEETYAIEVPDWKKTGLPDIDLLNLREYPRDD